VWEGPYVADKLHGDWVRRKADGTVEHRTYRYGERVE